MSLPDFLNASYALMAEEHQRINPLKDLLSVAEDLNLRPKTQADRPTVKTAVAQQNEQGMAWMKARLGSVPNAPGRKKPRRV